VIRVYDEAGNVIETHEQAGEFKKRFFISGHGSAALSTPWQIVTQGSNDDAFAKVPTHARGKAEVG
jgi:hypothetical protein